jgi:hypothetical protein
MECWQQALAADPNQWEVRNNLAWLPATARDPALRDGAKAVAPAQTNHALAGNLERELEFYETNSGAQGGR